MGYREDIIVLASQINPGETLRTQCVSAFCKAKRTSEATLTLTKSEHGLVWNCYRAGCSVKGAMGDVGHSRAKSEPVRSFKSAWDGKTYPVPDKVRARVQELWHMEPHHTWWWTTDYGGRLAMSIRAPRINMGSDTLHRGWQLRAITPVEGAKALTFVQEGHEGMSWYKTTPHRGTIIVEDIPSAVRASAYLNSVALLGTGVGVNRAHEIAEYASRPLYIALDQDATAQAFQIARKYALLWGDVVVLPLKRDLKNETEERLCELLQKL